jgi:hypothetical protein
LSNEKILTAGANVSITTDATTITIAASTGAGSAVINPGSAGNIAYYPANGTTLDDAPVQVSTGAGVAALNFQALTTQIASPNTGDFWVLSSAGVLLEYYLGGTAYYTRLSHTDGTVSSSSAGLMGTANYLITWSADPLISNEKVLTAGSSVQIRTDASTIYIDALTNNASFVATGTILPHPYYMLPVQGAKLYPNNSAALIDAGTSVWRLLYSATTQQYGIWQFALPNDYSSDAVTRILYGSNSGMSVAKSITWLVEQWGYSPGLNSGMYLDTFGLANTFGTVFQAGYSSGTLQSLTIPLTNVVSFNGGNLMRMRVSASGGFVGQAELAGLTFDYQAGSIASMSAGLVGSGGLFVVTSASPLLPQSRILTAGTNVQIVTDATAIYVSATTGAGASNSAGLAGTGIFAVTWSGDTTLSNEKILTAGSSVLLRTDATSIYIDALTNAAGGVVYAPTGGPYIAYTSDSTLTTEKILTAGSSVTIVTDSTFFWINAITNTFAGSGGLASTGGFYVSYAADGTLSAEKTLTSGSSTTVRTDATAIYIDANTANVPVNSGGLAGTGATFILSSLVAGWPNALYIKPGSSVTTHITGSNMFINATTSLFTGSGGLASTGGFYVTYTADATLSSEKILTAGSSVSIVTDATAIYINALTSPPGGVTYAPTGGPYIVFTSDATLTGDLILKAGSSVTTHTDSTFFYINASTGGGASNTNISSGGFVQLPVYSAKLYGNTSSAVIDAGTGTWRLLYSTATQQYGVWQFVLPCDYSGSPTAHLQFSNGSSLSASRVTTWIIDQWGYGTNTGSVSAHNDTFGLINSASFTYVAGYSAGQAQQLTIPLVNLVSFAACNMIKLRISSSAGNNAGNNELLAAGLIYRSGTQTIASGSGGLASTGGCYVVWSDNGTLFNEQVITAGTAISIRTSGSLLYLDNAAEGYGSFYSLRTNQIVVGNATTRLWLASHVNATALGATVIPINSACFVPFISTTFLKVDTLGVVATIAGSATSLIQLGIYTNSSPNVLYPFRAVSTSGLNISATNTTLVGYNPAITLSAGELYWFSYLSIKSAVTLRTIAVGGAYPIFGLGTDLGTTPNLYLQVGVNPSNGFAADYSNTTGNQIATAVPAIACRGSI